MNNFYHEIVNIVYSWYHNTTNQKCITNKEVHDKVCLPADVNIVLKVDLGH